MSTPSPKSVPFSLFFFLQEIKSTGKKYKEKLFLSRALDLRVSEEPKTPYPHVMALLVSLFIPGQLKLLWSEEARFRPCLAADRKPDCGVPALSLSPSAGPCGACSANEDEEGGGWEEGN